MKIRTIVGDLFKAPQKVMIHGCNAQGAFGAGVAGQVRRRFPAAFQAYDYAYRSGGLILGTIIWADCGSGRIGNAITQEFFGNEPGRVYVDYEAVAAVMRRLNDEVDEGSEVAMPMIGAGLAGGSWSRIAQIIETEAVRYQPVVYRLEV